MTPGDYKGPERRRGGPDRREPGQKIKILLVDDHALFRVGMRQTLDTEADFDVVAFSISFETDYVNVLACLQAAGVVLRSCERGRRGPLVATACSPGPPPPTKTRPSSGRI